MSTKRQRLVNTALTFAVLALAASSLTACGEDTTTTAGSPKTSTSESTGSSDSTAPVTAEDPWVKAVDSGMTAAFVTLENESDEEIVLVSASSPASPMVELHEMVMDGGQMVMQPKEGGIPIPANEHVHLEPGGDHIMLMDVSEPIEPGDVVQLILTFDDGSTLDVEATAKSFTGADEDYSGSDDH